MTNNSNMILLLISIIVVFLAGICYLEFKKIKIELDKHKETLKTFEEDGKLYNEELLNFNELYNNAKKAEDIKKRQLIIHNINEKIKMLNIEYKENGNTSILKLIVNLYTTELMPEIENLRRLKYDIIEVTSDDVLVQQEVDPSREETNMGEDDAVIKFVSNI